MADVTLPKEWLAIGRQGVYVPPFELTRWVQYGAPKCGKTYLWSNDPGACYLTFERGAGPSEQCRAFVVPDPANSNERLMNWDMFMKARSMLLADAAANKRVFSRVVLDPIDVFVGLLIDAMTVDWNKRNPDKAIESMTEFGQKGAGWNRIAVKVLSYLVDFERAGYGWTVVGTTQPIQETVSTFNKSSNVMEERNVVRMRPSLSPKVKGFIERYADYICDVEKEYTASYGTKPDGKPDLNNRQFVAKHTLRFISNLGRPEEQAGMRVPFPVEWVVPKVNPYDEAKALYERERARIMATVKPPVAA